MKELDVDIESLKHGPFFLSSN